MISNRSGAFIDPLTFRGWISRHYLTLSRFHKPDHNDYEKYSFPQMVSWCQHRGFNATSLPLQPERRFTWFYNLIENPELMFEDYNEGEIMKFIENNYPDAFDYKCQIFLMINH